MLIAIAVTVIVIAALLLEATLPGLEHWNDRRRARRAIVDDPLMGFDPGRERRAEQRARTLLRSCLGEADWAMYRDLGFVRVWGAIPDGPSRGDHAAPRAGAAYAYLVYPHRPIVAYLPQTRALLNEYCVAFPDVSQPFGSVRLPDSDDVLAKWMALTGDERRLIAEANMHRPGRQLDPERVRRDLWRLSEWERVRAERAAHAARQART